MLLPFFEWCESLWLGQAIVNSNWLFPVIEAVHLLALSVLGGAVFVVDLRLMGLGLTGRRASELWRSARPWTIGAIAAMILTGVPLFRRNTIKLITVTRSGEDDDAADRDRVASRCGRRHRGRGSNTARRQ